jgi:hypothetical protein
VGAGYRHTTPAMEDRVREVIEARRMLALKAEAEYGQEPSHA